MKLPGPWPPAVQRRLLFLTVANLVFLLVIALLLKEGASFSNVFRRAGADIAPVALAGFGMTILIFTGAIDLSIASMIALGGSVFGSLAVRQVPPFFCFAAAAAVFLTAASLNGLLIDLLEMPAIIFTLAALPFYRGLALMLADVAVPNFSGNISIDAPAYHLPGNEWATTLLAAGLIAALLLEFGSQKSRRWLALGASEEACQWMGLPTRALRRGAFVAAGCFLSLAGLIYITRLQSVEPARIATGFELQVIAAVVLGGTNIFGGEGSFLGTFLGAAFLYLISQVLVYAEASPYAQDAISGAVILVIIGLDCLMHRKTKSLEELQ